MASTQKKRDVKWAKKVQEKRLEALLPEPVSEKIDPF